MCLADYVNETLVKNNLIDKNSVFYSKYLAIVSSSYSEAIADKHHVIPRVYFKHFNLKVDDSKDNIVRLPIDKHILSHYYLYKCSLADWFKYSNLCALKYFTGRESIDEEALVNLLPDIKEITEEQRRLNSFYHSGKNNKNFGKHLSEETKLNRRL